MPMWRRRHVLFFVLLFLLLFGRPAAAGRDRDDEGEDDPARLQRLLDWAESHGATVDRLRPKARSAEDGRALYTVAPVDRGEMIVFVPSALLITEFVARRSPLLAKYAPSVLARQDIEASLFVSLFLFLENVLPGQRHASVYAAYYASLPPFDFDFNIPLLFWQSNAIGREALDILVTPDIFNRDHLGFAKRYARVLELMRIPGSVFDSVARDTGIQDRQLEQMFRWATAIVMTRSWVSPHPSIEGDCALVPIIDMLDHEEGAGGLVAIAMEPDPETIRGVGIVAEENLPAAARVFDSYDPPGNCSTQSKQCQDKNEPVCAEAMLFTYGFLPAALEEEDTNVPVRSYCVDLSLLLHFADDFNVKTDRRRRQQQQQQQLNDSTVTGIITGKRLRVDDAAPSVRVGFPYEYEIDGKWFGGEIVFKVAGGVPDREAILSPASDVPEQQTLSIQQRRRSALGALLTEKEARAFRTQDSSYVLRLREGGAGWRPVPPRLLAMLRISEADKATLNMVAASGSDDGFMRPVNAENERRVFNELHELFSVVLEGIPSSEEGDKAARRAWEYHAAAIEDGAFVGEAVRIRDVSAKNYRRMAQALRVRTRRRRLLRAALEWVERERAALP